MSKLIYETKRNCRACFGLRLDPVLDLGKQPLANRFLSEDQLDDAEPRYPLQLVRCVDCGLLQLSIVVNPEIMFGQDYKYRSGYSAGWYQHCKELAYEIGPNKRVLDIGCLDGVLLLSCAANGCEVVGCDPSGTQGFVVKEFFGRDTRLGKFDVIVAQNVIAHVDDARGFFEGIRANLKEDGVVIIECPWLVPMIEEARWDTIYHEHLSYWGIGPMERAAYPLDVVDVKEFPDLHGGTMRFYLKFPKNVYQHIAFCTSRSAKAKEMAAREMNLTQDKYAAFKARVSKQITHWEAFFQNPFCKVMAGFGASAKGQTFLNTLWVRPSLVGIFDDTPSKQGLYTPGWHFPVLRPDPEVVREAEILVNLTPNWGPQIESRARELGFTGQIKSLWAA